MAQVLQVEVRVEEGLLRRLSRQLNVSQPADGKAHRQALGLHAQRGERRRVASLGGLHQCLLARSFADAGFVPVMEYVVVERSRRRRYQRALAGLDLRSVVLNPDREVVLRRDRDRPEKTVAERFVPLREVLLRELSGVGLRIDSSDLSAGETMSLILREQEYARV